MSQYYTVSVTSMSKKYLLMFLKIHWDPIKIPNFETFSSFQLKKKIRKRIHKENGNMNSVTSENIFIKFLLDKRQFNRCFIRK